MLFLLPVGPCVYKETRPTPQGSIYKDRTSMLYWLHCKRPLTHPWVVFVTQWSGFSGTYIIVEYFKFIDFKKNLKIQLSSVGKYYIVTVCYFQKCSDLFIWEPYLNILWSGASNSTRILFLIFVIILTLQKQKVGSFVSVNREAFIIHFSVHLPILIKKAFMSKDTECRPFFLAL